MPTVTTYPGVFGPYSPITFTRASTATYFDSTGTLQSAAIDVPRLDYNPSTLAAQGFLVEEARTNSIRNNTMQGAVAGTPGTAPTNWFRDPGATGLSSTIVGTGTDGGITYIDIRIFGTAAAASYYSVSFEGAAQVVAANGETWTNSVYLKLAGGSTSGLNLLPAVGVNENTSAGVFVTGGNSVGTTPTSAWQRVAFTRTLSGGATVARIFPYIIFTVNNGAAIDITLRIGLPQLELGAFATSVIPTTTTALTRSADVASVNTLSPWFNATTGTIYAEFLRNTTPAASTFPQFVNIDDGSVNNRLALSTNSSRNLRGQVAIAGVFTTIATANAYTEGAVSKLAFGYQALNHAVVGNGGTAATDTSVNVPSGLTTMRLGDQSGGAGNANGWLRRVVFYPRRLSNAELQAITA